MVAHRLSCSSPHNSRHSPRHAMLHARFLAGCVPGAESAFRRQVRGDGDDVAIALLAEPATLAEKSVAQQLRSRTWFGRHGRSLLSPPGWPYDVPTVSQDPKP